MARSKQRRYCTSHPNQNMQPYTHLDFSDEMPSWSLELGLVILDRNTLRRDRYSFSLVSVSLSDSTVASLRVLRASHILLLAAPALIESSLITMHYKARRKAIQGE